MRTRFDWIMLNHPCHTFGGIFLAGHLVCLLCCGCLHREPHPIETTNPRKGTAVETAGATMNAVLTDRILSTEEHAAWQVLHGILAYGKDFPVKTPTGIQPALQYLLDGGTLNGWSFTRGDQIGGGRRGLRARLQAGGYVGQGHVDQWLAILAQAGLKLDDTITVEGETYFMEDLVAQAQRDVSDNLDEEWSWTLIGFSELLPTTTSWVANDGETWSIERLVANEMEKDILSSTCGGTHRLIGIAMALNKRRAEGGAMSIVWRRAEQVLADAASTAKRFQNADGSFSTNYFRRPGVSADNAKLLATTGHTLELLALSLSQEELMQPWVERAATRLCQLLKDSETMALECGALYHAIHGLAIYQQRMAGS